jgi:hypothetical protein
MKRVVLALLYAAILFGCNASPPQTTLIDQASVPESYTWLRNNVWQSPDGREVYLPGLENYPGGVNDGVSSQSTTEPCRNGPECK